MIKDRFSINCDVETMGLIDDAAKRNHTSRSAVVRMFLQLVKYIPVEKLRETSPLPGILGIDVKQNIKEN